MKRRSLMTLVAATAAAVAAVGTVVSPAHAGQVGVTVSIQGSGSTKVVEGSLEDGASIDCDQRNNWDDRVTNTCPRIRNEEPFEAWVWLRPYPSTYPVGHWRFTHWTGCDETRTGTTGVTECAVRSPCCSAVEKYPKVHFDDYRAPTVWTSASFSITSERTVEYRLMADENVTFECRFDSDVAYTDCAPPSGNASDVSRTYATEGSKTIDVRAVDHSGNRGASSSQTVKVIDTALASSGPSGLVNSRSATFSYSSGAGTAYECALDTLTFSDCGPGTSKTYSNLSDGAHTFRVRARDGVWYDRIAANRSWTVDATAPETTLASHAETPGEGSLSTPTTAKFAFDANEPAGFECRLDGSAWARCTSPHSVTGLSPGAHKFEVRAIDVAGNVDPTPAARTWTVAQPDADADGYHAGVDCDDGNAAIRPGAIDSPGNGVDEDCSGADASAQSTTSGASTATGSPGGGTAAGLFAQGVLVAPSLRPDVTLSLKAKVAGRVTRVTGLKVNGVPGLATVEVVCATRARGCPFKTKKLTAPAAGGVLSLSKLVRTARFTSGGVLTVTVAKPGVSARTLRVTFRKGKAPKVTALG